MPHILSASLVALSSATVLAVLHHTVFNAKQGTMRISIYAYHAPTYCLTVLAVDMDIAIIVWVIMFWSMGLALAIILGIVLSHVTALLEMKHLLIAPPLHVLMAVPPAPLVST
jgi:hypothetical protein